MPRRATGKIIEHVARDGRTYRSLRFTAYGKRRFVSLGPVTALDAERELGYVLADVERGTWRAREAVTPLVPDVPTFHEFAETWWQLRHREWAPKTVADYRWKLEQHLLPAFETHGLDEITVAEVERYAAEKLAEDDPLSPRSINATITLLGQILEAAVDRDLIGRNTARGRGRKVREQPPRRTYIENAGQLAALLAAAAHLDREAREDRQHVNRHAILATLVFAGLRIDELCGLRWRNVDLAAGWLSIDDAKTPAGRRRVKIRGALRDALTSARADSADLSADAFVFATRAGGRPSDSNIRSRVLGRPATVEHDQVGEGEEPRRPPGAIPLANERLAAGGLPPLPEPLTPHSLRRTFCSLLYALGEDPGVVMDEMGHTDPGLALRIYRQAMRRGEEERAQLRALVEGVELADIGRRADGPAATGDDDPAPAADSGSVEPVSEWARLDSNQGPTDYESSQRDAQNGPKTA